MKTRTPRKAANALACSAAMLAAISAGTVFAQGAYYDPVRDVMVPRVVPAPSPYDDNHEPTVSYQTHNSFHLQIGNGGLVGGPSAISVDHGSEVLMTLESRYDTALQIEGYDLRVNVPAGQQVVLKFTAEQPGRFAYRLAGSNRSLGVLEVGPPRQQAAGQLAP